MRIIHISDLHFGLHNTKVIDSFLEDLAILNPDIIIISGDLTQRALKSQYLALNEFLNQLPGHILLVPGNHDVPLYHPLLRLCFPFKHYKKYVSLNLTAQFSNEKLNILGVNSVNPYKIKDGNLTEATIAQIKNNFSQSSHRLNILFFHHNINYFSGLHHPLNNAPEFIAYLKASPIHIVCTGHLHYANLKLIAKNKKPNLCAILHGGSLCSYRTQDGFNSFYVINAMDSHCTIDWRVFMSPNFISRKTYDIDFGN